MENYSSGSATFNLIRTKDFLNELVKQSSSARYRFYSQSMFVEPGHFSDKLCDIFKDLRARKIECRLNIDYFGLMFDGGKIRYLNLVTSRSKEIRKKKDDFYKTLEKMGVITTFLNKPNFLQKVFPYSGRNHSKLIIIDNTVYVGGMNFSDEDITNEDFMIKIENKLVADSLAKIFNKFQNKLESDEKININEDLEILIDSGRPGKSLILNEALSLVGNAKKSVVFINQFHPNGQLLKGFNMVSKKGVSVDIIVPPENKFNFMFSVVYFFNKTVVSLSRLSVKYFSKKLHSKLLMVDGKYAIFGSHNLAMEGVAIGTAELSIKSSDKNLINEFYKYYEELRSVSK